MTLQGGGAASDDRVGAEVFGVHAGNEEGAVLGVPGEPAGDAADPLARVEIARAEKPAQVCVEAVGQSASVVVVRRGEGEDRIGVSGRVAAEGGRGVPPRPGSEEDPAARGGGAGGKRQQEFVEDGRRIRGLVQGVKDHEDVPRVSWFLQ
ncbi:hypothetical protein [Streptomyces sp. NPDC057238]|uniref:hypothetical protein n=1 Tax=unclassified Streptomyces TaxID=2593676 RepID=UPI003643D61A